MRMHQTPEGGEGLATCTKCGKPCKIEEPSTERSCRNCRLFALADNNTGTCMKYSGCDNHDVWQPIPEPPKVEQRVCRFNYPERDCRAKGYRQGVNLCLIDDFSCSCPLPPIEPEPPKVEKPAGNCTYWYIVWLLGNTQNSNCFRTTLNRFPYLDFRKELPKNAMISHWIQVDKDIFEDVKKSMEEING